MKRMLWKDCYINAGFPSFPCPRCNRGSIRLERDTLYCAWEPVGETGPLEQEGKFCCLFKCTMPYCGTVVPMSGILRSSYADRMDENGEIKLDEFEIYYPKTFYPGPSIIDIARQTPEPVAKPIVESFSILWTDQSAAANKLRVSIESVLDFYEIPRKMKNKKGSSYIVSLNRRLEAFSKLDVGHHDSLDALRVVGNRGSHGKEVTFEQMLDSYEVYEDALQDIFAKKRKTARRITRTPEGFRA